MDRKQLAAIVGLILIVAFFFVFTRNKGGTTSSGQATIVTQGGTVTLVPKQNDGFVVVANLGGTNTQSKPSSNTVAPKAR